LQTDRSGSLTGVLLGSKLRGARERLGWSLSETAKRTGLSRAYISALELGRGKRPGADVVRRLEDVFGPLRDVGPEPAEDLPEGLDALAKERQLPESEIRVLAGLRIRGEQPQTPERWRFIYDALVASEAMDRESERMS
jgi:transcriptional regulator with XRE-family HTH domain